MKSVWIYVDTRKQEGDPEYLKVFDNEAAADAWFKENNVDGVALKFEVPTANRIRRRTLIATGALLALLVVWQILVSL